MSGIHWLASYPKSGNTWLRLLLHSYGAGGAAVDINDIGVGGGRSEERARFDEFIGVAASDLTAAEILAWQPFALAQEIRQSGKRAYLKTHSLCRPGLLCGSPLLAGLALGAVCLVRDPRDVALSLARHLGQSVDEAITIMGTPDWVMHRSRRVLRPRLPEVWGSWSQNVASWLGPVPFPVHILSYEQLRADPRAALTGILSALDLPIDPAAVAAAVAATDLAELRRQEAAKGFTEWRGTGRFFGEGQVQSWRNRLTPDQVARIESDHGPVMRRLGYLVGDY